jgi:hypothetical protein
MNEGQWCRLKSFVSGQWLLALPFSYPITNNAPKGRNRRVLNFFVVAPYWRRSRNYSSCGRLESHALIRTVFRLPDCQTQISCGKILEIP